MEIEFSDSIMINWDWNGSRSGDFTACSDTVHCGSSQLSNSLPPKNLWLNTLRLANFSMIELTLDCYKSWTFRGNSTEHDASHGVLSSVGEAQVAPSAVDVFLHFFLIDVCRAISVSVGEVTSDTWYEMCGSMLISIDRIAREIGRYWLTETEREGASGSVRPLEGHRVDNIAHWYVIIVIIICININVKVLVTYLRIGLEMASGVGTPIALMRCCIVGLAPPWPWPLCGPPAGEPVASGDSGSGVWLREPFIPLSTSIL